MCVYTDYIYNLVNTNHYLSVQKGIAELSVRLMNYLSLNFLFHISYNIIPL